MDDRLDIILGENLVEHSRVADIALIELRLGMDGPTMPRLEVIDDDDILSLGHELMHSMGTDIAGTAANKNRHIDLSLSICFLF